MVTLILGGAKSGKSAFALSMAEAVEGKSAFIATAQALDEEMAERIDRHKTERLSRWKTFEEPLEVAPLIKTLQASYEVILLDCLTLWITNVMLSSRDCYEQIDSLIGEIKGAECSLYFVANEVGMGIVPENKMARQFRDYAGALNRAIAAIADEVYLVVAGIPVKIK